MYWNHVHPGLSLMPLSQKLGMPTLLQGHLRELILSKKSPSQDLFT